MKKNLKPVNPNAQNIAVHADHPRPVTRRQFIAAGLIPAGGYLFMPSVLSKYFPNAITEAVAGTSPTAVIEVSLAGGACIANYYAAAGSGGMTADGNGDWSATSDNYALLGHLSVPTSSTVEKRVGLPLNPASDFTKTLLGANGLDATTVASTRAMAVAVATNDDSNQNLLSFGTWATLTMNSIVTTNILPKLGVDSSTNSGGRHMDPGAINSVRPLIVRSGADLTGAVSLGNNFSRYSTKSQAAILKANSDLGTIFGSSVAKFLRGSDYAQLVTKAHSTNIGLASATPVLLAANDANAKPIWDATVFGTAASFNSGSNAANITHNVLQGQSPYGNVEIGGADYHGQGTGTYTSVNSQAAEMVVKIIKHASLLKKKVMVVVNSDGSTRCSINANGLPQADGDDGQRGSMLVFYYNPVNSGDSLYVNGSSQSVMVGNMTSALRVDNTTDVGGSPQNAASVVYANWLNSMGLFDSEYAKRASSILAANTAAKYLVFK